MNLNVVRMLMVLVSAACITSCQVGKKPVRKNVSVDKYAIKQRYGLNTVDTAGRGDSLVQTNIPSVPTEQKKSLITTLLTLSQKQIPFTTFSGKAKMHYVTGNDKQEFVSHIRMKRDSVIWVNVTAMSGVVSVARIFIKPDSVFLVNYLQKEVRKLHIDDLSKLLPARVDFSTMQNLIIGNVLKQGGNPTDAGDFGGTWSLQLDDTAVALQLGFNKSDSNIRSMQMRTADNTTEGMMQFGSYEVIDNRKFSQQRVITINNAGESHYLDMNFNKVEFDQPLEFPFSIPKNYVLKP